MDITFRARSSADLRLIKTQIDQLLNDLPTERLDFLNQPISNVLEIENGMYIRIMNALHASNIITLKDLVQKPRYEISRMPNLGNKSLHEIEKGMRKLNLNFADA
jgi:DNA-directed RNA polymerase alpha subunit